MTEVITAAEEKKFSDFMDNVRPYLDQKLRDNDYFQQKSTELKSYQNMKDIFSQIEK